MAKAKVKLPKKAYVFSGSPREPKPTVILHGEKVKRKYYTVTYKSNKRVGVATVRVAGVKKAGYKGSARATFRILPAKTAISNVMSPSGATLRVSLSKVSGAVGYQFRIGADKGITTDVKSMKSTHKTVRIGNLKEGTRYYVRARAYTVIDGKTKWGAWSKVRSATVKWKPLWAQSGDYFTYRKDDGKLAIGLVDIDGRTYLFDGSGRQKTGWQYYQGTYRYFNVANGSGGYMQKGCVKNGIALDANGVAQPTGAGWQELSIMWKAQQLVERLTVPTQSRYDKLVRGFYYIKNECVEALTRNFTYYDGWHREMALDVFDGHTGSCFSYGAALAYYANAIGYGQCAAVSSGGHGWAEIDGLVYDAEWSRHCGRDLFAISYGESGAGVPAYASARFYVVEIASHAGTW